MAENRCAVGSEFYDVAYDVAYSVGSNLHDVPFYEALAFEVGSPVRELGCCTGRASIPIVRWGYPSPASMASPALLKVLRGKLERAVGSRRDNLRPIEGDIRMDMILSGVWEEHLEPEWVMDDSSKRCVERHFIKDKVDPLNQNSSARFIYRVYRDRVLETERTQPLQMSDSTYPHLKFLISAVGLEIAEQFGSSDRQPLWPGARDMICICRSRAQNSN